MDLHYLSLYVVAILFALLVYLRSKRKTETRCQAALTESVKAGLTEPPSLHPVIDPVLCLGAGACVTACPENALGMVDGKAVLINASACIGHGACAAACPHEAIQLVFGTEKRGVDIPQVGDDFQTNVPGVYIAGELGGMGLIRKAAEQGRRAMENVVARRNGGERGSAAKGDNVDVIIVGAGPAGLAAALTATHHNLRYVTIEQEESLGGSILHYPRQKVAMTSPMHLPIVGKLNWREISKEQLIDFWSGVMNDARLDVRFRERMETLERLDDGFRVRTSCGTYQSSNVLLSIGRKGTPRKLGVPGEDLPKVVYRLLDPAQYAGRRVLVVGGGDSAVEAAIALANEAGTGVSLSYRGAAFSRLKAKNRERCEQLSKEKRIELLLESTVDRIAPESVVLNHRGRTLELPNDNVLVFAGGVLPTAFLKSIGINVATHHGIVLPLR